jgi:signal transduction histidine kinase
VSDTVSKLRKHWVEIAWGAFSAVNIAIMFWLTSWETVPFHFVWVSLTIVYGFRVWRPRTTFIVLVAIVLLSGTALVLAATRTHEPFDEVTEVPLMTSMFLAMVWHARRRQTAMEETRRHAEGEHRLLERQREFVRDASHELRTPITVARGHIELIRSSADGQMASDADVALDELARLSRVSERLLLLAAAEDPMALRFSRVEVRPLLTGMADRWGPAAPRRWEVCVASEGWVQADRDRLELALDSMVENAVKFTHEGDRIAFVASAVGRDLSLEVVDGGIGVAPGQLGKLFDPFTRVADDRARSSGGTGLGLAIVRTIAEAHGGSASADSVPGGGSTFRITLPGFHPSPAPSTQPSAVLATPAG